MAIYYFRNSGNTSWGTASNWSLTDGGLATGAIPTSADDAYFTSNSGDCVVDTIARVCRTLIFSGVGAGNYTGTFSMSQNLTVSGNVTLSASMGITGTSSLIVNSSSTLRSNGKTWSAAFTMANSVTGGITYSLADNWSILGDSSIGGGLIRNTITGGRTLTLFGNATFGGINNSGTVSTVVLAGTGVFSCPSVSTTDAGGYSRVNFVFNTTGTITCASLIGFIDSTTVTYTSGTVSTTGSTLILNGPAGITMNTNGITWNNITLVQVVVNLLSDLSCSGTVTNTTNRSTIDGSAYNFNIGGGLVIQGTSNLQGLEGSAKFVMNGTGSISMTNPASTCYINISLNIAGAISLSTNLNFGPGFAINLGAAVLILTNSLTGSGTITIIGSSGTPTINGVANNSLPNLTFSNVATTLTVANDFTVTGNCTFQSTTTNTTINGVGRTIFVLGTCSFSSLTSGIIGGTGKIRVTGTNATITMASVTSGYFGLNLEYVLSGTLTINSFVYRVGTFTHTSGAITGTAINFGGGWTVNGDNLSLSTNMNINAATVFTLGGTYSIPGTLTTNGSVTFAGVNTISIGTFSGTTAGLTHSFVSTRTYNITNLSISASSTSRTTIRSTIAGSKAIINLGNISTNNYWLNVTDIDSSGGAAGYTLGTVSTSNNWNGSAFLYYVGLTNWSATSSWSSYSGGVPISSISVPTSGDDVLFDVNSGNNCTLNVAAVCKTINFTGYTRTLTLTNGITVSGSVTLTPSMLITGSGTLTPNATCTLTSNGATWSGTVFISASTATTFTFGDNWTLGTFSIGTGVNNILIAGGRTITCLGSYSGNFVNGSSAFSVIMGGTGSLSGISAPNSTTINTAGTITMGAFTVTSTFTYTAGTVVVGLTTLTLYGSPTLAISGVNWYNIDSSNSAFVIATLTQDLYCVNYTTYAGNLPTTINGAAYTVYISGNLTHGNNSQAFAGSSKLVMNGTGNLTNTGGGAGSGFTITVEITGNITLVGTVNFNGNLRLFNNLLGTGTIDIYGTTFILGNQYRIPNLSVRNITLILTLSSGLFVTNFTVNNVNTTLTIADSLYITGTFSMPSITTGIINSSFGLIVMSGTGTLSMNASVTTGYIAVDMEIASSNVTITNTINYRTGTFKLTASPRGTGTLNFLTTGSLDGRGFTIPNLRFFNTSTSVTSTISLVSNITVSNGLTGESNYNRLLTVRSSVPGTRRLLTLSPAATSLSLGYINFIDIDASGGRKIWAWKPTLSNTSNIFSLTNNSFIQYDTTSST